MALESLNDLYVEELKDLYSAENQIIKALPKMIKAATNPDLKQAFADHLEQTKGQVARLVQICEELGESPKGKKCNGMEGILEEGKEMMEEEDADPAVLDAALASAAQHVEHYEIAGYGSVRTWAEQLGYTEHVTLLQQTLDEEKTADKLLSELATTELNIEAEAEGEEEGEEEEETEAATPARASKAKSRR